MPFSLLNRRLCESPTMLFMELVARLRASPRQQAALASPDCFLSLRPV